MARGGDGLGIEAVGLSKAYGRAQALSGLDVRVGWGEALVALGRNGSGKTTLVKALATLLKPDAGEVRIAGMSARRMGVEVRRALGVVTHDSLLYEGLTGGENLRFFARMYGVEGIEGRVREVAGWMGVEGRLDARVGTLSHGMRRRLSIARALLHSPRALVMDEPDSGLDQQALGLLDAVVRAERERGAAILMTTHNIEWGMALGDRVAILSRGRIGYEGAADAETARVEYGRLAGCGYGSAVL